jgi:hypothetical protein
VCWKKIKRWFGGDNGDIAPTPVPLTPPDPLLDIPYPEEPENPAQTMENTDVDEAVTRWMNERGVPQVHRAFWRTKIEITLDPEYPYPAGVWESSDGIRHLTIRPSFVNTGVIAHEQAHSSYALLSGKQKKDFKQTYDRLKVIDPLILSLFAVNDYGLRNGPIEGHAEFYRYLGEQMPGELMQYYPKLFVE